jgi:hypothetical protein
LKGSSAFALPIARPSPERKREQRTRWFRDGQKWRIVARSTNQTCVLVALRIVIRLDVQSNRPQRVITEVASLVLHRGRYAADHLSEIPEFDSRSIGLPLGVFGPPPRHDDLLVLPLLESVLAQPRRDAFRGELFVAKVCEGPASSGSVDFLVARIELLRSQQAVNAISGWQAIENVRFGSMVLKKDFEGAAAQLWCKKPVGGATLIRIAGLLDSIVAYTAAAADFFNSIGHGPPWRAHSRQSASASPQEAQMSEIGSSLCSTPTRRPMRRPK